MAPNSTQLNPTTLSLLLLLTMLIIPSQSKLGDLKETTLSFYFHDHPAGPNATAVPVTGIPGSSWNYVNFGTLFVADDAMTEGFHGGSTKVGRGQGIFVTSAVDGSSLTLLMSIVFTNKEYNGSTLQIQGADRLSQSPRESAVVGGTGKFRFARGYVVFETFHVREFYDVVRCNITVQHY